MNYLGVSLRDSSAPRMGLLRASPNTELLRSNNFTPAALAASALRYALELRPDQDRKRPSHVYPREVENSLSSSVIQ